jgi:hypothetical protein
MKIELFNQLPKDVIVYISRYLSDYIIHRHGRLMFKFEKHCTEHIQKLMSSIPKKHLMPIEHTINKNFISIILFNKVNVEYNNSIFNSEIYKQMSLYRSFNRKTHSEMYKYKVICLKHKIKKSINKDLPFDKLKNNYLNYEINYSIDEMGNIIIS